MTGTASAGTISIGNFGSGAILQDFEGLSATIFSSSPAIVNGNSYTTDSGIVRYHNFDPPAIPVSITGQSGFRLATFTDLGFIDISLGTPVNRVGAFIVGEAGFASVGPWTATAEFFDVAGQLLGSVFASNAINISSFAGWQADTGLIKRIRFTDTSLNGSVLLVDNLWTQVIAPVPLPAAFPLYAVFVGGMGLFGWRRTRHAKLNERMFGQKQ